jgi:acylglycerol lipase
MPRAQKNAATEEFFRDSNGVQIFFRSYRPTGKPRAVVVICHGVNSHGGQYVWAAEQFVERGFAVYAIDLRGRGRSEGRRFHINDVSEYVTGLKQLIAIAKSREPGLPVFLLGHSAGGVVSTTYVLDNQEEIDGFICESFAFRVPAPKPVLAIIRGLNHIAPKLPVLKLKNEDFSRDPQMVATLNADPLTKNDVQPVATVAALLRANDRMEREFGKITLPLLIMHGTADNATVPAGSVMFHDKAGSADKTLKLYEGNFHDLLADTGREGVINDMVSWIEMRIK